MMSSFNHQLILSVGYDRVGYDTYLTAAATVMYGIPHPHPHHTTPLSMITILTVL